MSLGDVVEGHDIVAELSKQVCAKGNESPERDLERAIPSQNGHVDSVSNFRGRKRT